jgi:hypothetical protein
VSSYDRWDILLAWLPSSDGTSANHAHPCIYLGESPRHHGCIKVIGITSDLAQRDQVYSVDMPWAPGKHPDTGLDKPSIAQTLWRPDIPEQSVCKPIGYTPKAQQQEIGTLLKLISDAKKANP